MNNKSKIKTISIISYAIVLFLIQLQYPMGFYYEETMKYKIPMFIFKYGRLPTTFDSATYDHHWGVSYAQSPNGSFIIESIFMKIFSFFGVHDNHLYLVARGVNILFGCIFMFIVYKIAEELLDTAKKQYIFVAVIVFWNLVGHIFSFVYFEGLMLVGIAVVVLYIIKGINTKWGINSCIGIGIGNGIILISYIDGIGYCFATMVAFIATYIFCINKPKKYIDMIKKGILIILEAFIISGWFYIRNYVLYGSFLGKQMLKIKGASTTLSPKVMEARSKEQMFQLKGFLTWVKGQIVSFSGKTVNVEIKVISILFLIWAIIILALFIMGIIRVFRSEWKQYGNDKKIFTIVMLVGIISTFMLDWYYQAFHDYNPFFGRYFLPMIISLVFFILKGLEHIEYNTKIKVISKGWIFIILFMVGLHIFTYCCLERFNL